MAQLTLDKKTMKLFEKLVKLEDKEITFSVSGGFFSEIETTINKVKGISNENNSLWYIMIEHSHGKLDINCEDMTEIRYNCKETLAKIVVCFKNDSYLHFFE